MIRSLLSIHIQNARQSIKANRLRSALTMLGVTIGVASITTILALSAGATQIVSKQIDDIGGNIAVVRPGPAQSDILQQAGTFGGSTYAASTLTSVDVAALQNIEHVSAVAPLMVLSGAVTGTNTAPPATPIVASTPDLQMVSKLELRDGQFLDPSISQYTAVIGAQLSIDIFGTEQSLGKTVAIKGTPFTIVGILKRMNAPVNYNNVDFDRSVVIPLKSGRELNQDAAYIQQINLQSDTVANLSSVMTEVNKTLLRTHLGQVDFHVVSGAAIAQPTSRMFLAIAGVSVAIAAISLLVGGVGIMNIMLVNVIERTREIGIRKALGATNGDIVGQFLIEALVISIGGGVSGYVVGYALAFILSMFLTFDPVLNWETAVIALGVSGVVGVIFGLYPAIRAARRDPISALRLYD